MIWNQANQGRQSMTADNHLARFIGRNYLPLPSWDIQVLDIGPGKHGANQTYMESLGLNVTSIDISPYARANIQGDVTTHEFPDESFDVIVDVNALCHVKDFDYGKMRNWLKPAGRVFSIMPAYGTWGGHLENKGFVLTATRFTLDVLFSDYSRTEYDTAEYTYQGNKYASWLIQARK